MAINSFSFVVLMEILCICIILTKWFLGGNPIFARVKTFILLLASYIFMASADARCCICIFLLTVLVYYSALQIEKGNAIWLKISVALSVLQLVAFKYLNFFADSFTRLLGMENTVVIQILIPVGVSFYTFSGISYLIDVYRNKISANPSFTEVALYISFFPKLASGPIVRAKSFFAQLDEKHSISGKNFEIGIQIFVCGLFKKMVLADHLSIFVDDVFSAPAAFTGATVFLATITYSLQIYFDFSGYSDLAIGIAKILGFDFKRNFDIPYISKNVTEFWKRWHISLSSWLQEYLYYPLGGNRKGKYRTYLNLLLTMLIGGLWHGANWTFIIWGGMHGTALIIHKVYISARKGSGYDRKECLTGSLIAIALTFLWVNFCWIFFRASSLHNALDVIKGLFQGNNGISHPYTWTFFAIAVLIFECIVVFKRKERADNEVFSNYLLLDLNRVLPLTIFLIFVGMTIIMAYVGDTAFIYGKF